MCFLVIIICVMECYLLCLCCLGNMFSTIRGHVVEWMLLRDEEATQQQLEPDTILNFVPFAESLYTTDPTIAALEEQVCVCGCGCVPVYVCMRVIF